MDGVRNTSFISSSTTPHTTTWKKGVSLEKRVGQALRDVVALLDQSKVSESGRAQLKELGGRLTSLVQSDNVKLSYVELAKIEKTIKQLGIFTAEAPKNVNEVEDEFGYSNPQVNTEHRREEVLEKLKSYLLDNPKGPCESKDGSPVHIGMQKLAPDVKLYDCRGKDAFNMFHHGHVIENLDNTIHAIVDKYPDLANELQEIRHTAIEFDIKNMKISTDIHSKTYVKDVKEATEKGNQILGRCYYELATRLDISVKDLENLVTKYNSKNIAKTTIVCIFDSEDGPVAELAEPMIDTMHTSADRASSDVSNFFKRTLLKCESDQHGGYAFTESAAVKTHSSLPTISVGEKSKLTGKTSDDCERFQGSMKAFDQVLSTIKPVWDEKRQCNVIKMSQVTLFTAATEMLDRVRGMESEHMQLSETKFLYELYDGQTRTINGQEVLVEIEHTNAGMNSFAVSGGMIPLDKELEKSVNDKGMCKMLGDLQRQFKFVLPRELNQKKVASEKHLTELEDRHKEELLNIRNELEKGVSDERFKQLKERNSEIQSEFNQAYAQLAAVQKEIFQATVDGQANIVQKKTNELKTSANPAELKKEIQLRKLSLEAQYLYFSEEFRDADKIQHLQLACLLIGKLRGNEILMNCKSGEDRTGALATTFMLANRVYDKFGEYPNLSTLFSNVSEPQRRANSYFFNADHRRDHLQFGVSAQINNMNNPGAGGFQIEDETNPLLKDLASATRYHANMAKKSFKAGREMEANRPRRNSKEKNAMESPPGSPKMTRNKELVESARKKLRNSLDPLASLFKKKV